MNQFDLLIFSKAPNAYEPSRIYEEAHKSGLTAKIVSYPRIDFIIRKDEIVLEYEGGEMPQGKYVVFRAAGGDGFYIPQRDFLLEWYEERGSVVLNSNTYKRWPRLDKVTQHFEFQKGKVPFVQTTNYGANNHIRQDVTEFPVIMKMNLSSQGRDVHKVDSKADIETVLENYRARTLLVQPFLTAGVDVRVIVIGGRAVGAMKRIAQKGSYLTNYSQGGSVEPFDLTTDSTAVDVATAAARHFKCDYVGVDLMSDGDGNWVVLEINRSCQFQGFEKATKLNVPQHILTFFGLGK